MLNNNFHEENKVNKCPNEKDGNLIINNLWLGNYKLAYSREFLKKFNIKIIINVSKIPNKYENDKELNIKYINLLVRDKEVCNMNIQKEFEYIINLIHYCLNNNMPVLVHCKKGHHRSASIIAAYLIKYKNYSYFDAIESINKLRNCALLRNTCMNKVLYNFYLKHIKK
jgi:protein-tyrosine phosphatase